MVPSPSGVTLTSAQKKKWLILAKLPYQVARLPCSVTLHQLGIEQSFRELCEVGQLSGLLFAHGHPSYHRLTLEFLSTLTVNKNRQAIVSITFQLKNTTYDMPIEQFNEIFGFTGVVTRMPFEFSHGTDKFWEDITTEGKFSANRAKSSSIRNPVLRILQKACVCYPFARVEHGSITRDELFLLWQILYRQPPLNLGHFMIKHLERAAKKKKKGILCVGAVISAIALHLGVDLGGLVADIGELGTSSIPSLDITFLKRTAVIASDRHAQIYLKQKAGDHFPLPNPDNTYVGGPEQRANWLMNSSAHRQITSSHPGNVNVSPSSSDEEDDGDEEEGEENEEAPTQHGGDGAGPSTSRRRNRGNRVEEDINAINNKLEGMDLKMDQLREHNDAQWIQWHQENSEQWANVNAQLGNFFVQYDERWTALVQQQQDFMANFRPPHHPPNQ